MEGIANVRISAGSTINGNLEQATRTGDPVNINQLLTAEHQTHMASAFVQAEFGNLTGAKELLDNLYDYGQLRLFRAIHGEKGQ